MKKLIFTFAAACLFALGARAQWVMVAGADFSDFKLSDAAHLGAKLESSTGYTFGVTRDFNFPMGLGIHTGLQFVQRNARLDDGVNENLDRYSSLEVPLNLKYRFNLLVAEPFLVGGPYVDYGLWAKQGGEKIKYGDDVKRVSWGMTLGAGVDVFKRLRIMYQYDWGLTEVKLGDMVDAATSKARGNRVTVGILF
jgi:hypothetical protein